MSDARGSDLDHLRWLAQAGIHEWQGKTLLDLGCGSGHLCRIASLQGARTVVGVDLVPPTVAPDAWTFLTVDLEGEAWAAQLAEHFPERRVDHILAFDIIEHLASPVRFLEGCRRLLAPQGKLVLTTPNIASWERLARGRQWSGATDPQHRVLFSPYSLGFLLERTGFSTERMTARMRALEPLGRFSPPIGAQIFAVAKTAPD